MTFLNVSLDRQFAVLRDQAEALDLLQTATRVSTEALREAVGVPAHGFEKWLSEAAPTDQKKLDAEKANFKPSRSRRAPRPCRLPRECHWSSSF